MDIVFFGTPDIAVESLKKISESEHNIKAVVTVPDKQKGRGLKTGYSAVKEYAVSAGYNVLQPESLSDEEFISELRKLNADVFVVVAFRILPESVYSMPPKGCFNMHGSILPKYRGAAPIQWAIINGDSETGVTTFFLQKKVDTGEIILQYRIEIDNEDDFGSLYRKISNLGAEAVVKTLEMIEKNLVIPKMQDSSIATTAPKISKEICRISWEKKSSEIVNLIRGLSPIPGAYFIYNDKSYKVFRAKECEVNLRIGEVQYGKGEVLVGAKDGCVSILEIQPEGRKRMSIDDFLRGYKL